MKVGPIDQTACDPVEIRFMIRALDFGRRPRTGMSPALLRSNVLRWLALCLMTLAFVSPAVAAPQVYRDKVVPNWSKDGDRFWYRNSLAKGETEFILVDAAAGKRAPAFDHARVAEQLSRLMGKPVEPARLPIDALAFGSTPDELLLVASNGSAFRLDLRTGLAERAAEGVAPLAKLPSARRLERPRPSRNSAEACQTRFVNETDGPIELFWIDQQGERRSYGRVKAGEQREISTYVGHVWAAVAADGRDVAVFESQQGLTLAAVRTERREPRRREPTLETPEVGQATTRPSDPVRPERQRSGARRSGGRKSPDGQWTVTVQNDNLFLRRLDIETGGAEQAGDPLPLTSDGKVDDGYALDRLYWSPDSAYLVAIRLEAAQKHEVHTVESSPRDRLEPRLRTIDYLRPGDKIARPRPMLFRVADRTWIPVSDELFPNPWSIRDIRWAADSSRFTFSYNQRGHQVLRIVAVDAATGKASAIVDEKSPTFLDYSSKYFCRWIGEDELLWASERDGYNHLYLYDARTGRVKNQVTRGHWVVQGIDRVDVDSRQVFFRAGGIRAGQDPYYTHVCRVNFDGTGLVVLTEGDGTHAVEWSPDGRYLIDRWSRVDLPPVTELRRAEDGAAVCKLESADATEVQEARGGRWPVRLTAKGRDGTTDIYGVAWLPRDFDPAKKYPVVEHVYAGPHGYFTPKAFSASSGQRQAMADRGFIVVQSDGMGTNGRGKAFHDICWKNLKDGGFPDRIALIRHAAKETLPQMDLSRVGIYGGSAGGQNAMAALLWHHDFYRVAVADCGCHDNRMDKIWWNEQWMGWPVDDSYERSSNVVNAHLLEGKLMLIVGELDSNVDPSSTFQTAAALQRARKDFELVVVIGAGHGAAETPYGNMKRSGFLERHLLRTAE